MAGFDDDPLLKKLRNKLQAQAQARGPEPAMSAKEIEKRRKKLYEILRRLENRQHIQNRMLKRWLDESSYREIEQEATYTKIQRDMYTEKPEQLKEYERILKDAQFCENRANSSSGKGKADSAQKFRHRAEALFERALEYMQEILAKDPTLEQWLDRDFDYGAGGQVGPDPHSVPRVRTSRSRLNELPLDTRVGKRDLKIAAVKKALRKLDSKG